MSSSPKYTVIDLSSELSAAARAEQRRRAAALRERQAQRAAELQRLRAERARRALEARRDVVSARLAEIIPMITGLADHPSAALAGDARALAADLADIRARLGTATNLEACLREAERLRTRAVELRARERETRRAAEFQRLSAERAQRALDGEHAVISARLAEVDAMVGDLAVDAQAALAGEVRALAADLGDLHRRLAAATDQAACLREAERLRARAVDLQARERKSAGLAGRQTVLADLRERLAAPGPDAAKLEASRYARCAELLGQLEASAAEQSVRFEALHGTVEHEVASYVARSTEAALAARAKLDEATDQLTTIRAAAESALADARALGDEGLAEALQTSLTTAVAALAAAKADPARAGNALAEVTRLAEVLPDAEARLDELAAAHERRAAFAETLKGVLAEQGMLFLGASDTGDRFILQFERPGGAMYTAAVDDGEGDELQLSYAIDGEADVPVLPEPGQAVCDQTEAFLDAIHADLVHSGYHAGELRWDGKPPRGAHATRPRLASQADARQRRIRDTR
jgi:bacterioferritin-associated ferredoxin